MKNLYLIPTSQPSRLYKDNNQVLTLNTHPVLKGIFTNGIGSNQHIYITNDEEIKEDYVIAYGVVIKVMMFDDKILYFVNGTKAKREDCKKIIMTTDQDLIKDSVQAIDDEFLEWFVQNPSCEEVRIEEEDYSQKCRECGEVVKRGCNCKKGCFMKSGNFIPTDKNTKYKIIIPKEENSIEAKQRAKNYMSLKGALEPKDVILGYKTSLDAQILDKVGLEEPKQETLEEAAERISKTNSVYETAQDDFYHGFVDGAKWQQEQMYSEEELKSAFKIGFNIGYGSPVQELDLKNEHCERWLSRFKKK